LEWIGVPVSIGIAPSKTLAKLASDYAKKHQETGGALYISQENREYIMAATHIRDV
jgi:DNA polymerase V